VQDGIIPADQAQRALYRDLRIQREIHRNEHLVKGYSHFINFSQITPHALTGY
jgi:hypothetical protein